MSDSWVIESKRRRDISARKKKGAVYVPTPRRAGLQNLREERSQRVDTKRRNSMAERKIKERLNHQWITGSAFRGFSTEFCPLIRARAVTGVRLEAVVFAGVPE
jgi:hypothetical protein